MHPCRGGSLDPHLGRPERRQRQAFRPAESWVMSAEITWRRLDIPGSETARLEQDAEGWRLTGNATFAHEGADCALEYDIRGDESWRTRSCRVSGHVGDKLIDFAIDVDAQQRWTLNGRTCTAVEGAIDIDLNFSPSTNLLPIRRLGLRPGESAPVKAAWLRFPNFALEPLLQEYRRLDDRTYRYESANGTFVRDLKVDATGFVTDYPGFWRADGP
jgi:uncharacterized protein